MTQPPFRSNRDVAVHVSDVDAAVRFYHGVLGFPLVSRAEDWAELDTGAMRLWINGGSSPSQGFVPSLDVPDAAAARAYLEAHGCAVVRDHPTGSGFYFRDPFGLVLDVIHPE